MTSLRFVTAARVVVSLTLVTVAAATSSAVLRAEQTPAPLKQLSLEALGDVEVTTASKEPQEIWRTAAAIYVISQEDIRRSGFRTLPAILRLAPGVHVAQIDSTHWSVGIRGFGDQFSKSVLVLIDGRSVYTPLFAGVLWAVQDALIDDIERIEVIGGPGGTIWGANAVNGVINIVTKSARETPRAFVQAGTGDVDRGTVSFRYGATANGLIKRHGSRVWATATVNRGATFHVSLPVEAPRR